MKKRKPTYDPRCYDLAELFLEDEKHLGTQDNCEELAGVIQTTIENFIYFKNAEALEEEGRKQAIIRLRDPDHALEDKRDRQQEDRFYSKAAGRWITPDWEPPDVA